MAERLGDVLYWAGCLFAGTSLLLGVVAIVNDANQWEFVFGISAVPAVIFWLLGRACRYVLAGR